MPTLNQIAKTIVGPNDTTRIPVAKLHELQDVKWGRLKAQEQSHFLRAARYILELFEREPDGYVILNGDNTKARCWNDACLPGWTTEIDKALWFARRADAERFGAEDEDAWCVLRVSDVRVMWASRSAPIPPPVPGNALPVGVERSTGAIITRPPPLPHPEMLPVCQLSEQDLLRLFRQFVTLNATQWKLGSGDHHHPIWASLAEAITTEEATFGPDWQFIQPENRTPHAILLRAYTDNGGTFANS